MLGCWHASKTVKALRYWGGRLFLLAGWQTADLGESGLCGRVASFSFHPREMGRRLSTLDVRTQRQQPPRLGSPENRDLSPSPCRGRSTGRATITVEPEAQGVSVD